MDTYTTFSNIEKQLSTYFVERKDEIHGLMLGLASGTNVLFVGPPGTAKSLLVSAWAKTIKKSKYFSWQLNQFSTPEELFGPYSLNLLDQDRYKRVTKGKLPEADIAFIDEVFKCSHGNLNAMLSILNERVFFNDGKAEELDLLCVVGASNEIPEEGDKLDAFMDRFSIKHEVLPIVENKNFAQMLKLENEFIPEQFVNMEDIRKAQEQVKNIHFSDELISLVIELRRHLSDKNSNSETKISTAITDRMFRIATRIIKAEAWSKGKDAVEEDDFEVLQHVLWSDPADKQGVYSGILEVLNPEKSKIMELFYNSKEIYDEIKVASKEATTDKTKKAIEPKAFEAAQKIRNAKGKVNEHIKDLEKRGRKTEDLKKIQEKMEHFLNDIYEKTLGTVGFKGWE